MNDRDRILSSWESQIVKQNKEVSSLSKAVKKDADVAMVDVIVKENFAKNIRF